MAIHPMRRVWLGFLATALLLPAACPKRVPLADLGLADLDPERARARLEKEGLRRQRVSGLFKARTEGVTGLVASVELDILAEKPSNLHIAVRSFFGQPARVFATDGGTATLYEAGSAEGPLFFQGPVTSSSIGLLLPIPLWPAEAVALFLGVAPAAGARALEMELDDEAGTYIVTLQLPDGGRARVTAGGKNDAMRKCTVWGPDGRLRYRLSYDDHKEVEGIVFAHKWRFEMVRSKGNEVVVLEAKNLELNGEPFDPRAFALTLPPGHTARPLESLRPAGEGP
jgi:hypothetical protein